MGSAVATTDTIRPVDTDARRLRRRTAQPGSRVGVSSGAPSATFRNARASDPRQRARAMLAIQRKDTGGHGDPSGPARAMPRRVRTCSRLLARVKSRLVSMEAEAPRRTQCPTTSSSRRHTHFHSQGLAPCSSTHSDPKSVARSAVLPCARGRDAQGYRTPQGATIVRARRTCPFPPACGGHSAVTLSSGGGSSISLRSRGCSARSPVGWCGCSTRTVGYAQRELDPRGCQPQLIGGVKEPSKQLRRSGASGLCARGRDHVVDADPTLGVGVREAALERCPALDQPLQPTGDRESVDAAEPAPSGGTNVVRHGERASPRPDRVSTLEEQRSRADLGDRPRVGCTRARVR